MSTKCRSCNKAVHFAKDDAGKTIILDAVAPVYRLMPDGSAVRAKTGYVSHFATCRDANQWGSGKTPPPTLSADDLDLLFKLAVAFAKEDSGYHDGKMAARLKAIVQRFDPLTLHKALEEDH